MKVTLGVDVACQAAHQASCVDEAGRFVWSGIRFRTSPDELARLWERLPANADEVEVVLEPTRNAWVPLAAWFRARGARVLPVPPEQAADLRRYYHKHAKSDRLDSRVLARLPLLHAGTGLHPFADAGPADPLRRAVRRRAQLVERRVATCQRIDAPLELLGPDWGQALSGTHYGKTALDVLHRGLADPNALRRFGRNRLTALLVTTSRGQWREDKADALLAAAGTTLRLWGNTGELDFAELAKDLAGEARIATLLTAEIEALEERIQTLYQAADPNGIIASGPGCGVVLAAAILGGFGDLTRFANLAGVRAFTGLVPHLDQSGTSHRRGTITRAGDPALRAALFLAADQARRVDPQLAARYHRLVVTERKHHTSAVCTLAAVLATRLAACWRAGKPYVLRDTDGAELTAAEGQQICASRYQVGADQRAAGRTLRTAQRLKTGTSRRRKESPSAPATGPSAPQAYDRRHPDSRDRRPVVTVTVTASRDACCLVCAQPITTVRSTRRYCSPACRQRALRARQRAQELPSPPPGPRKPSSVYECPQCETRYAGEQWCPDCQHPCRRLGLGAACPHCSEPITIIELMAPGG